MNINDIRILRTTRYIINAKNEYEKVVTETLQARKNSMFSDWQDVSVIDVDEGIEQPKEGQYIVATPFQIDPSDRDWEYDDGGVRVYKTSRKPYVL